MPAFTTESGIDSSISLLVGGMLLAAFVFLSIMGMNILERDAETALRPPEEVVEPVIELGAQ